MTAKLPTYVINLQRSADRRKFMEAHLSEFPELECQFIPAVDGKLLKPEDLSTFYDDAKAIQEFNRPLSSGEIGCALSHIECYRKITTGNERVALVLEDDVLISSYFPSLIPSLSQWLDSDTPKVALLTPCRRYWQQPAKFLLTRYRLHKICGITTSTAAYLINRAAAGILIERLFPAHTVADHWQHFRHEFGIDIRVVAPHCVSFRPCSRSDSTIGGSRHNGHNEKKWIRRLKNLWFRPLEHLSLIRFGRRFW